MSRLIMWNLLTLDGFFEGPANWSLDWIQFASDDDLQRFSLEQLSGAGALLFGRVTYQGMAAYWQTEQGETARYMNSLPKVVASRTLHHLDWNNSTLIHGDIVSGVRALKLQSEKDIFVFGSANLSATLIEHGLFDEYRFGLAPVLLGDGHPLFPRRPSQLSLSLVEARPLPSGCLILRYVPRSGE